ncbi:MAG: sensor histidine kinase [Flavobacteriaceae bacterium]|nr:MAG: sensor histidine kinase [Flavobacteriaceae bacterium]
MKLFIKIIFICCLLPSVLLGQDLLPAKKVRVKGVVIHKESRGGIKGVLISEFGGTSVYSNFSGDFVIYCTIGNELEISHDSFETRYVIIKNDDRIRVEVTGALLGETDSEATHNHETASKRFLKSKSTTSSFEHYMSKARATLSKNPEKSISFIEAGLGVLTLSDANVAQAKAYDLLGDAYKKLKQFDLAEHSFKTSLKHAYTSDTQLKLAKIYAINGKIEESNKEYRFLLNKNINPMQRMIIQEGLGDNLSVLNELRKAEEYYEKSLDIAKVLDDNLYIANLNSKIGACKVNLGNKSGAKINFEATMESAASMAIPQQALLSNTIANHYKEQQDFDKEIEFRSQALEVLEQDDDALSSLQSSVSQVSVSSLNLDLGKAYANKKAYKKAIPFLEKSKLEAKASNNTELEKKAVENLSDAYKNIGDYKKALASYQDYVLLVDALYKQKEADIKAAIRLGKDLTNKQNRINSLEKDRELATSKYDLYTKGQELTVESYKRQRVIIYSLIVGLLLMLLSLFFMYRSNKQRKLANNLLALKSLRSQMNPHFIFNALNSVNSFIAQNDERAANRYLTEFSKLMRNVLNNSEKDFIVLGEEIELLELYLRLEHQRFEDKFDYELIIDPNIETNKFLIPPMLLQPYIENAVWHGLRYKKSLGKLTVAMHKKEPNCVEIVITDNGIGRSASKALKTDNQKKQESKGMNNINERIAILNDMYGDRVTVSVADLLEDGSGTKVVLVLKKN